MTVGSLCALVRMCVVEAILTSGGLGVEFCASFVLLTIKTKMNTLYKNSLNTNTLLLAIDCHKW